MKQWISKFKSTIALRLFAIYFAAVAIPFLAYGVVSYNLSAKNVESEYIKSKINLSNQLTSSIDENVLVLQKQSASLFLINKEINYMLSAGPADTSDTYFDYKELLDRYFLALIQMNDKLNGISLIDKNGEVKYAINIQGRNSVSVSEKDEPWFKETLALNGAPHFIDPHTNDFIFYLNNEPKPVVISVAQSINDYSSVGPIGVLVVDQNTQQFFEEVTKLSLQNGEQVAIVSRTGKLIYSNAKLERQESDLVLSTAKTASEPVKIAIGGRQMLLIASSPSQYGFKVVSLLPVSELKKKSGFLKNVTIVALIAITGIVLAISIVVSFIILTPIRRMMPSFKKLERGDFTARVPVKGNHELSRISMAFNAMVQNIERLIREKYEVNLLRKQAEFSALQSQINPHFLYNTLFAAQSVIDERNYGKASAMVQNLSEIFRYSLNQGAANVTLREELEHIRKYLHVHEIRTGKFTVHYDVPEALLGWRLPRLTLQPFVENAMEHGFAELAGGGEIHISAKAAEETGIVYVYDNGRGMSEEILRRLQLRLEQPFEPGMQEEEHIGIANVHARIQLQFGEEYGVKISSKAGVHTTIKITAPLHAAQAEEEEQS